MRTTDGSLVVSSLNGQGQITGQHPFRWIGRYAPTGGPPVTYALQTSGAQVQLIDVTNPAYGAALATYTSTFATPSFVQAEDFLAIALGFDVVPQLWQAGASNALTNSWHGDTKIAQWVATTALTVNTPIVPTAGNGHVYVVIYGGTTGSVEPTWPTGVGARIQNGSVMFQEAGPSVPPVPPGASSLFFHGGFLFAWGTSASYRSDGINGPDTLWQSDLLNFNSWNTLNTTFIGKGDGNQARGGGVLTVSEAGIIASSQLVLFKDTSTYLFFGFFPNWSVEKAPNGVGCVAPGTVRFLAGLGLMRLCYRGVALFDGQDDVVDEYTDPIREYLFGADEAGIIPVDWQNISLAMAGRMDNPAMYLLAVPLIGGGGALTRILAYDVTLRAWCTPIDLPWGISSLTYIAENPVITRTLFGTASDGTIQAFGNNCASTWNGTLISWGLRTPEIGAPETPSYVRRLNVRGQAVYSSKPVLTSATLNYQDRQGKVRKKKLVAPPTSVVLTASLDVDETVLSANIDLTGQDRAILEGLGYQYTPKPPSKIGGALQSLEQVVTLIYQQGGSISVPANAQSVTVTLPVPAPNANYVIQVGVNWNTTVWWDSPTVNNFVVYFATPAPPDGTGAADWSAEIFQ